MAGLMLDIRAAFRSLLRAPAFSMTVVGCLALGIGANTAIFSVVKALLLQPLPFSEPSRLVSIWVGYGGDRASLRYYLSGQQFVEIRDRNTALSDIAATRVQAMSFEQDEYPVEVSVALTTPSLFPLIGVQPILGRPITTDDETTGALVTMLSEGFWQRSFGSDPSILGSSIRLDGDSYEVIGVMPDATRVPPDVDAWIPLNVDRLEGQDRLAGRLTAIARLAKGISVSNAADQLTTIAADIASALPERNTNLTIGIAGWQDFLVEQVRPALLTLTMAVGAVLLLAVTNVASLLVVRALRERRHQALRVALGANMGNIVRYLSLENGLLVVASGVLGVVGAAVALPILLQLQPSNFSAFREVTIDGLVLGYSTLMILGVTAAVTGFSIWRLKFGSLVTQIADGGAGTGINRTTLRTQSGLVVFQVAISIILLVGSSVMIQSFYASLKTNPGFDPDQVLVIGVSAPPSRSATHEGRTGYYEEMLEAVRSAPGVVEAGAAHTLPVIGVRWSIGFNVEGQPPETESFRHSAVWRLVTRGYHRSMSIPVIRGRPFDERDQPTSLPVAIVSESLAASFWPDDDPLGKRIKRGTYDDPTEPWRTVIGIIPDIRDSALTGPARAALHLPHMQYSRPLAAQMSVVVRAGSNRSPSDLTAFVTETIRGVDRSALIHTVSPYAALLDESLASHRFNIILVTIFAVAGLVVVTVGVYGVISYAAAQRQREFGIRMAFGARSGQIQRLMLLSGARVGLTGAIIGLFAAYWSTPLIDSLLPAGGAREPMPYIIATLLLLVITMAAVWFPAARASRQGWSSIHR